MRFLTGRLREKDEENKTESDWKFAAMVIDRSYISFWLPKNNDQWRIIPEKYKYKKNWQGTQTWNLSKNLHDRIFVPKVLHTKNA